MKIYRQRYFISTAVVVAVLCMFFLETRAEESKYCRAVQPFPYPAASSYPGLHANRENNNRVPCSAPEAVKFEWKALDKIIVFQPMSISADGGTIYATVGKTDGCKLYAVDTKAGKTRWCKDQFTLGVTAGTPEVDADGNIYVTDGFKDDAAVYSLTKDGEIRWKTSIEGHGGAGTAKYHAPAGVHLTPSGYVATVTTDGVVVLLSRSDGKILTTFDIPAKTGFVAPAAKETPIKKIPPFILDRLTSAVGPLTDEQVEIIFGAAMGASGAFSDNTVSVTGINRIFVVGGGRDPETGSLMALDIIDSNPAAPEIRLVWSAFIKGGSATSPAVSSDGGYVVAGDGAGNIVYVDRNLCDSNADADPAAGVCAPLWTFPLLGKSLIGSVGLDEDGVVYVWNTSKKASDPDLLAVKNDGGKPLVLWKTCFAEPGGTNRQWTSSATVTDNFIIGTLSDMKSVSDLGVNFPIIKDISHELVAVDRKTGVLAWRVPISDDSINSIMLGPDGSIYVPLMGLFNLLSMNNKIEFHGGIDKYSPMVK